METQRFPFCFPQWERALNKRIESVVVRGKTDRGDLIYLSEVLINKTLWGRPSQKFPAIDKV